MSLKMSLFGVFVQLGVKVSLVWQLIIMAHFSLNIFMNRVQPVLCMMRQKFDEFLTLLCFTATGENWLPQPLSRTNLKLFVYPYHFTILKSYGIQCSLKYEKISILLHGKTWKILRIFWWYFVHNRLWSIPYKLSSFSKMAIKKICSFSFCV